jgi:hypothetical protein
MAKKQATLMLGCDDGQFTLRRKIVNGGEKTEKFPPQATNAIRTRLVELTNKFEVLAVQTSSSFDFPKEYGVNPKDVEALRCALEPTRGYKVVETSTRVIDVNLLQANMKQHACTPEEAQIWEKCLQDFLKRGTLMFQKPVKKKGIAKLATERFEVIVKMSVTHHTVDCALPK